MASLPSSAAAPAAESKSGNPDVSEMQMAGRFFFVNPRIVPLHLTHPHYQKLQSLIQNGNYTGAYTDRFHYDWACQQVRSAGEYKNYACGYTIDPSFFNDDKMKEDISYVILYISERPSNLIGMASSTRSGGRTLATNGFVALKDLSLPHVAKQENMLYIEGLCVVNSKIVPSTKGAAIGLMDMVHRSSFHADYEGCKLSALVYVIQFYFNKFSYRFRRGCNQTPEEIDALRHLNTWVSRLPRLRDDDEAYGDKKWLRFLFNLTKNGHNTEVKQRIAERLMGLRDTAHEWNDEDEIFTSRVIEALQRAGWEDQGYYMYFCYYNNPMLGILTGNPTQATRDIIQTTSGRNFRNSALRAHSAVVKALNGGKKKRRKKTKKKALRKKHRKRSAKTHKKKRRKAGKSKRKRHKSKRKHKKK
jgi:hypothetical protein